MKNQRSTYDIIFFISVFLICIFVILSTVFIIEGQNNRRTVERRRQMEMKLNNVLSAVFEMESKYRGVLLLPSKEIPANLEIGWDSVFNNINKANQLTGQETGQQRRLQYLQQLVAERKRLLELLLSYHRAGEDMTRPEITDLVRRGSDVSNRIRSGVNDMLEHERTFVGLSNEELYNYDKGTLVVILTFGCITLLIVVYGHINIRNENKRKQEIEKERSRIISQLEESEQRYRSLNDTSNDAIIIVDHAGKIISFNQMAGNIFGYTAEEVLDKHAEMLLPNSYRESNYEGLQKYLQLKPFLLSGSRVELKGRKKSGRTFPAEVTISYWNVKDAYFFGASIRDITIQKQAQEKLNAMMNELRRSNEDLEQFAYIASHDLQEPLRKIRAFGERLTSRFADEDFPGRDYALRMVDASERMQVLIRDLLSFSRVSRDTSAKTKVDLNDTLKAVLDDMQVSLKESQAVITIEHLPVLPEANALQMHQLFLNLLSNAIKFRKHEEAPVVRIAYRLVEGKNILFDEVKAVPERWYHEILISDNGIGFEMKYLEKIFTIFQRLHGRNEVEYRGTGIGLALCRKICTNHEGFITARSVQDEGTDFFVFLPGINGE